MILMNGVHNLLNVSGEEINYYFVCSTKLWLFSHGIELESFSDLVSLGKFVDKTTYKKEKGFIIDNAIQIDFIKNNDFIELHEIKLSQKLEKAHEYQLLYYMYYLKNEKDIVNIRGFLDYPKTRKKKEIFLTKEKEDELNRIIEDINQINSNEMPKPKKSKICRKCAYFEFCFS